MSKTCIIITGPTAVGKTALAVELARNFSTEIISADSRQCFKELNIAVAKPNSEELSLVHHYFINSHTVTDNLSAAGFEKYALESIEKIFQKNDIAVMVGGTGLYIKAFEHGLDEIPLIDDNIRQSIKQEYSIFGMDWLQQSVLKNDPQYYSCGETYNPQRMIRALEVKLSTGRSITSFQQKKKKERDFTILKFGLELPRQMLYERINSRVDAMIAAGLVQEAESLVPFKHLNALQTVGYRELFDYFDEKISLPDAVNMIKQNTRHYAKRQLTWFKKDGEIDWLDLQKDSDPVSRIIKKAQTG